MVLPRHLKKRRGRTTVSKAQESAQNALLFTLLTRSTFTLHESQPPSGLHEISGLADGKGIRIQALGIVAAVLVPTLGFSEISKEYATLHFKYIEAQAEAAEPLEKLDSAYRKKLNELEAAAKRDGDFARVTLIRDEIDSFQTNRKRATDQRLRAAQSKYELSLAELQRREKTALESISRKYISALEKMKVSETKAGRIDSAKLIQKEIEKTRDSMKAGQGSTAGTSQNMAEVIPFSRFVADKDMEVKKNADGVELTSKIQHENWYRTRSKFSPPFKATVVAKTDSTNIRLLYGDKGRVIFNWELNRSELRLRDPATGQKLGVKNQGEVPINEWVTIELIYREDSMTIFVNGKERHQLATAIKDIDAELGIGPAFKSVVNVKSFSVQQLPSSDDPR